MLCTVPAAAQELHGRVRESYQSSRQDRSESDALLQEYQIRFRNFLAPHFFWQARLRALISDFDETGASTNDATLLEPFFQLVYEGDAWQVSGGGRFSRTSPKGRSSDALERQRQDLFARMSWEKLDRPSVDWSLSQIDIEEEGDNTTTDARSLLTLRYSGRIGGTSLGVENRAFENHITGFTRDIVRGTWNGNLREALAGGRFLVSGQALVVEGKIDEETPDAVLVDEQVRVVHGLFAQDMTPASGILTDTPTLIDGNLTASAADLSGDFRNFGVELPFPETVEKVFLYVERRLLPGNDADYAWDVYTSDDGDLWTAQFVGASARFEELQNRFEIEFFPLTVRFLKIVNTRFSRDEPPLAATEIEVFRSELREGRESRRDGRRSADANFTWRARDDLTVGLSSFASRQSIENASGPQVDEDWNTALTTTLRPGRWTSTLRLQALNRSRSLADPEQERIASLGFSISPIPRLDLSLIGTYRRTSSRGDLLTESDSVNARIAARFVHDIEMALDLTLLQQTDGRLDRTTNRSRANLSLVTTLRPGLFLSNNWGAERIEFEDGDTAFGDRTDLDLRSRLSYRPSRVLGASMEYSHQDIAGVETDSQIYDVDWLPFPGGALQIQLALGRNRRSSEGTVRDEARVGARWTLNPKTLLETSYSYLAQVATGGEPEQVVTVFLEYRF